LTGPSGAAFQVRGAASKALALGAGAADLLNLATSGVLSWVTGLGVILHITGPTDQDLKIRAPSSRALVLGSGGADQWTINADGSLASGDHTANSTLASFIQKGNATCAVFYSDLNNPCIHLTAHGNAAAIEIDQQNHLDSITSNGDIRCQQSICSLSC